MTYLEDVRPGAGHTTGNRLDETGHLAHHINAIQSLSEGSVHFGRDLLAIGCLAGPGPFDRGGLGPVALGILLRVCVADRVVGTGVDDLAIFQDTADVDLGRPVGRGSGVLHHDGGVGWSLEVQEVPAGS